MTDLMRMTYDRGVRGQYGHRPNRWTVPAGLTHLSGPPASATWNDLAVAEYTISSVSGDDWPVLPRDDFPAVLQPRSLACHAIEGDGDHSFRTGDTTVSASWELAGTWYVCVDGAPALDAVEAIVAEMAQQLGEATGRTATYHHITDQAGLHRG